MTCACGAEVMWTVDGGTILCWPCCRRALGVASANDDPVAEKRLHEGDDEMGRERGERELDYARGPGGRF